MSQSFFNFLNRYVTFNSFRHAFGVPTFGVFHRLNPPQAAAIQTSHKEGGGGLSRMWLNANRLPLRGSCQRSWLKELLGQSPNRSFLPPKRRMDYKLDVVSEISETVGGLKRRKNGRGYSPSLLPRPGETYR